MHTTTVRVPKYELWGNIRDGGDLYVNVVKLIASTLIKYRGEINKATYNDYI